MKGNIYMNEKPNKNKHKTYSFRKRIFILFTIVIITFFIIFIWIAAYFTHTLREKTYESVRDTLEVYNQQLTHNLDKLHVFMFDMSEYSLDIAQVFSAKELDNIYNRIMRSKQLLDYSIPSFTEIEGMFLYAPLNDTFIQSFEHPDGSIVSIFLKNRFRTLDDYSSIHTEGWTAELINNEYYLIRTIEIQNSFIGSWAKISRLTAIFENVAELNGNVLYVDEHGKALTNNQYSHYTFPVNLPIDTYHIVDMDYGKALLVINELDYCDYYLVAIIPLKSIDKELGTLFQLFAILFGIIIAFSVTLIFSATRFLSKPIHMLEFAANRMRKGDFNQKIPENISNCQEIIDIDMAYNRMIDEIHHLQIDIYEEKLAKSEIELQYLKSQIAPHFLINCLYSIMSLADSKDSNRNVLHKMIKTLSEHLRYTLNDQTTVPLSKEIYYVKNYIELTKLRFPNCLTYSLDIAPATENCSVFPLILLMFTENSIKFNMVMGEALDIKISAKLIENDYGEFLHLIHIDSGDGFSDEQIKNYNDFIENFNQQILHSDDSSHIGIPNVAKRLKIVYGPRGDIKFSNEPNYGARIDLIIPNISIEKDGI